MSGGNETPRQKMIGMMYLVLTALLALQISAAIINKFIYLDKGIYGSVERTVQGSVQIINKMEAAIEKSGNRPKDIKILEDANSIRAKTNRIIQKIEMWKTELIEACGGLMEDDEGKKIKGVPVNKAEDEQIHKIMIGAGIPNGYKEDPEKAGYAYQLKVLLDNYNGFIEEKTGLKFESMALSAEEDPLWKNDPDQSGKDFAHLSFEKTPAAAALAVLSQIELRIASMEEEAMNTMAEKVGAADIKFDLIMPMVKPESKIVAAGTKYVAELFLAASSSGVKPEMKFEGKTIEVNDQGVGLVEFRVTGGRYIDGKIKKTWKGVIELHGMVDTTFIIEEEYIVAEPVIQIQSAAVSALYLNCGNELFVLVPALGQSYNPSFSVIGGRSIKGTKKGLVTIVPNAGKVTLKVSSGGTYIGKREFKVKKIPLPRIVAYAGGRQIDLKKGMDLGGLQPFLTVKPEAEPSFKEFLPNDARYRVKEMVIYLRRGKRLVTNVTAKSGKVNIREFKDKGKSGDVIVIEIKKIQRLNFKNAVEIVDLPSNETIINIPLH